MVRIALVLGAGLFMNTSRRLVGFFALAAGLVCTSLWLLYRAQSAPVPTATGPPEADAARPEAARPDPAASAAQEAGELTLAVWPAELELCGPGDGCQLTVSRDTADAGTSEDLTRACRFELDPPGALEVSEAGFVRALAPGSVRVSAVHGAARATARITVRDAELPVSDFALDIVPILTKAGCNSGQCHGSAQGKGGLHLSLFGYDPASDHAAITRELEGRRIDAADPPSSLLLLKPSMGLSHGGRLRLAQGAPDYERLRGWIEAGTPWRDESRARLESIHVEPHDRFLRTAPADQQLTVLARYSDGIQRDVTRLCLFVSNDPATVTVAKYGLAHMQRRGQADVVVRFTNQVATVRIAAPFNDETFDSSSVPVRNFIDERILEQLEHMRLPVSPRASDAEFLRRVYLDLVGHMPDPNQRADAHTLDTFFDDSDPDKRDRLIDQLLEHPDFVLFWALKLGDHLQINSSAAAMGNAAGSYRIWLANQLKRDKSGSSASYDTIVRTLLLAKGSLVRSSGSSEPIVPAATYYAAPREPTEIAEQVARRFLGIRIRCARCHDHPLDVWTQNDYYGFASFFGGVRVEPEGPSAQAVRVVADNLVRDPRTNEAPAPRLLDGTVPAIDEDGDAREKLVDWMLDPQNPRFARMAANWVWAHLMGRGLVEPVDDLRETNPPVNERLLDELAASFRESGYDLRALVRTICRSEAYQRASAAVPGNERDEQFGSHALVKPLSAAQMADAIAQVTGVPNQYGSTHGPNTRAIEVNDPNVPSYLLDILGRCDRTGGCEVGALARTASLKQALHLIIGEAVNVKLAQEKSVVAQMAQAAATADASARSELRAIQIRSVYLRAYCRPPTPEETEFWQRELGDAPNPKTGLEDMLWAILNSREFAFNH